MNNVFNEKVDVVECAKNIFKLSLESTNKTQDIIKLIDKIAECLFINQFPPKEESPHNNCLTIKNILFIQSENLLEIEQKLKDILTQVEYQD